jgi:uncharacterized SAM-binding protein YcdF (DUF218 family)
VNLILALEYCRTLLKELLLPPSSPLLLAIAGLLLVRRTPRLGPVLVTIGVMSLWLLSTPIIADGLSTLVERYPPLDLTRPTQAQAIVILGGGGYRNFAPEYGGPDGEPYMMERLAYGAYLSRRTGLPILVTGFKGETVAMRVSLQRAFGIAPRWVDDQSYDTFQNAGNTARLLLADGVQHVILVTRASHLWRASREFTAAGLQVDPAPSGSLTARDLFPFRYFPNAMALVRSHDAIYEALGEVVRQALAVSHLRRH